MDGYGPAKFDHPVGQIPGLGNETVIAAGAGAFEVSFEGGSVGVTRVDSVEELVGSKIVGLYRIVLLFTNCLISPTWVI